MHTDISLSSAEASFCRREAGEREKKERRAGDDGIGEALIYSHRSPRAYNYIYWDTQREPLRRRQPIHGTIQYRYNGTTIRLITNHCFNK